jgi:branched-chain amino acid transport system permease protein
MARAADTSPREAHAASPRFALSLRAAAGAVVWIAATLLLPVVFDSPYYIGLGITVGLNALLALGLIVLTGYAGQFSLGQAAFYGIGAYGSGLLTVRSGLPPIVALVVAAAAAGLLALVLGRPLFRLRGHFLAMGTLALNEIMFLLFNNLGVTGASSGFGGIAPFSLFGFDFASLESQSILIWLTVGSAMWISIRIGRSRKGRGLKALRSQEIAASSSGVDLTAAKTQVFVVGAVFASVAGSLYAHHLLYVNPPPFALLTSINILVIAVVGGLATPWGALVGALTLTLLRQGAATFTPRLFGEGAVGAGETFVVGAVLILVLTTMPDGITEAASRGIGRLLHHDKRGRGSDPPLLTGGLAGRETGGGQASPGEEVVLRIAGLTKRFGGVTAVSEVDLQLREYEILGVIGPNGAGKTTLINLVSGAVEPTAGTIELGGHDVTGLPSHKIAAQGLARTFQTPSMFEKMTVRENVLVGAYLRGSAGLVRSSGPTVGVLRDLLHDLDLWDLRDRQATELSLGHQKVLEIGRALAQHPAVLLLDEPAAGLNRAEKQRLANALRRIRLRGVALLLVEHDMELVMGVADRVHVLNFGCTLRVGTPDEVQADPEVVKAYLGSEDDEGVLDVDA